MASRNETGLVSIDKGGENTRLTPHLQDLEKLHECFPGALWPRVEATPAEMGLNNKLSLYPGRVLIGQDEDEQSIWAYLWQVNRRGDCSLDFYIGDTLSQVAIGNSKFWNGVSFEKWCVLLASTYCPAGSEAGWETKVKAVVKIVMLEHGYYDGTMSIGDSVYNTIRQNQGMHRLSANNTVSSSKTASEIQPRSHAAAPGEPQSDTADTPDEAQEHTYHSSNDEDFNEAMVPGVHLTVDPEHTVSSRRRTPSQGILPRHIEILREAFPPDVWPRVEQCDEESSKYYSGKVYIGRYSAAFASKDPSLSLWARVTKKHALRERFGHVICTDDKGKSVNFRKGDFGNKTGLTKYLALDTPFQLIDNGEHGSQAMEFWRASMYLCVRIALVEKGFVDGPELTMRMHRAHPKNVGAIIKNNLGEASDDVSPSTRSTTMDPVMSIDQNARETQQTSPDEPILGADVVPDRISPDIHGGGTFMRRSLGLGSENQPASRQETRRVPAKRSFDSMQGAENKMRTSSTGSTSMPSKTDGGKRKRKSNISSALLDFVKKAMPPTPGSPAHNESTALREDVATLQAEIADLKSKIDSQDTDRDDLQGRIKLQDEQNNKLMAEWKQQAKDLQTVRAELKAVKTRNATLVAGRINVESKNISLEAKVAGLQAEADVLKAFKQTHVLEAQPRLVELMTMENMVDDAMGEDDARRAAELRYVAIFGIPIAETDDGE